MKNRRFAVLAVALWVFSPVSKGDTPDMGPPVRELLAQEDYSGIEALLAQLDSRFEKEHTMEYFGALRQIIDELHGRYVIPTFDPPRNWLLRKILWQILLAPASPAERGGFWEERELDCGVHQTPIPVVSFDRDQDQFVALRKDAALLMMTYHQNLKELIIPGYETKIDRPGFVNGLSLPPTKTRQVEVSAQQKAEYAANAQSNWEQDYLAGSLRSLDFRIGNFILKELAFPPQDDETVEIFLTILAADKAFDRWGTREVLVRNLQSARAGAQRELDRLSHQPK